MTTPAGGNVLGGATIRVDANTDPAVRAIRQFSRDADGRLRDLRGRFVSENALIRRSLGGTTGDTDRFGLSLRGLTRFASAAGPALGRIGLGIGAIGAAAGTAAPLLAGIVTTLENIAPAGAIAATGLLAIGQAQAVVQLGMVGIKDAATAAFDTSAAGTKKFDQALKQMAPNARKFALEIKALRPELVGLQHAVQNRLFAGLDSVLKQTARATLPVLRRNLVATADSLRIMAEGTGVAAQRLATSGVLGQAMKGANQGLANLESIPPLIVTALGQLATAGAPALDRLTSGVAQVAGRIGASLSGAFQSGALTGAVNTAFGLLKDLGAVAVNVFHIIGNVIAPVQKAGGGLINTLKQITDSLVKATASKGFQQAILVLSQTMGVIAQTVGPLLGTVLATLGPLFTRIAEPIQNLVRTLGTQLTPLIRTLGPVISGVLTALAGPLDVLLTSLGTALQPVLRELGPVLSSAVSAVGALTTALSPLLPVVGNLVASLLPPLVPVVDAIAQAFTGLSPIVAQVGQILTAVLAPVIARLPAVLTPLVNTFTQVTAAILPLVSQLLTALTPALTSLGESAGKLLVAVSPLLVVLGDMFAKTLIGLTPLITQVITVVGRLASFLAGRLATTITTVVVPAVNAVAALLKGNFSGAWRAAQQAVAGAVRGVVGDVGSLAGRVVAALGALASGLAGRARSAGAAMVSAIRDKVSDAVSVVRGLPGRVRAALGNLSGKLVGAGRDLVDGFAAGIRSRIGSAISAARDMVSGLPGTVRKFLQSHSPSRVFIAIGKDVGRGLIIGLTGTRAQIKATATNLADDITRAFKGRRTRVDDRLVNLVESSNKRLQTLAAQRDKLTARIQQAQQFAKDLTSQTLGTFSLQAVTADTVASPLRIEQGLANARKAIRRFTDNIKKLQKLGLRKDLIQQILGLGPEQGAQLAATLAGQSKTYINHINKLQSDVASSANVLGRLGADALFDSGKKAGAGFLTGLKGQRKAIEDLMLSIAKSIQKAIKKALGIKSPSRVFAGLGADTAQGFIVGLTGRIPALEAATERLSAAVAGVGAATIRPAVSAAVLPARTLTAGTVGVTRTVTPTAAAPMYVTVNVANHGVLGSQGEVEVFFTRTLERLRRQRRLPFAAV
jgi:phage-related protein